MRVVTSSLLVQHHTQSYREEHYILHFYLIMQMFSKLCWMTLLY